MKVFGIILCVLSFNVYAESLVCNSFSRVETIKVEVNELENGKVDLLVNKQSHFSDGLTDFNLIGYKISEKPNQPTYNLNPEKVFNLVDEEGQAAELVISESHSGPQSRVPCYETRAPMPHCSGPLFNIITMSLKSKKLNLNLLCN